MGNIIIYCLFGIFCLSIIIYLVATIVKFCKMSDTEKRSFVLTYLKGLVAYAERELGSGKGAEKLLMVENTFKSKAPIMYKILIKLMGVKDIKELIELALTEIKKDFKQ